MLPNFKLLAERREMVKHRGLNLKNGGQVNKLSNFNTLPVYSLI